jgi:hypothetical protein
MENYDRMLEFFLRGQEANRLAFETAKFVPFLFIMNPPVNSQVEPWQPLLFEGNPADSLAVGHVPDPLHVEP